MSWHRRECEMFADRELSNERDLCNDDEHDRICRENENDVNSYTLEYHHDRQSVDIFL